MRRSHVLALSVLVPLLAVCGGDGGPMGVTDPCTDDTGTVAVTVSGGATPVFDWTPPCAVALLLIEQDAGDTWVISTDDATWDDPAAANLITPPVTYGVAPAAAADEYGPDPLVSGLTHDVILWRIPPGSTAGCLAVIFDACMLANHQFVP